MVDIILQHLPSLYGSSSTWSHKNDSYYENKQGIHSQRYLKFFFFFMWVGGFWREQQIPLAKHMMYTSMQINCDTMWRQPIRVHREVRGLAVSHSIWFYEASFFIDTHYNSCVFWKKNAQNMLYCSKVWGSKVFFRILHLESSKEQNLLTI